ncbi:MAG: cupin domain-containing protein [Hyphomicrobiales bacterium]
MQIHADLSQRAVVRSDQLDWQPSPMAGVERRMLERDGNEVARATSIVRYAPESHFSAHTHSGGEEFIVLDGVFSDEMGDFAAGTYVRNPVGSSHTPASAKGCIIFVKLWQMPPDDQEFVRIDMNDPAGWGSGESGEEVLKLHVSAHEYVRALRWQGGAELSERSFPDGAEYFVLDGSFSDAEGIYPKGTWLRIPPGGVHTPATSAGCTVYIKTGHLTKTLPRPTA